MGLQFPEEGTGWEERVSPEAAPPHGADRASLPPRPDAATQVSLVLTTERDTPGFRGVQVPAISLCVCVSHRYVYSCMHLFTAASQHDVPRSHNTARLTSHLVSEDHEKVQDWKLSRLYFFDRHS